MRLQVEQAIYLNDDVTPYPEYLKKLVREGRREGGIEVRGVREGGKASQ